MITSLAFVVVRVERCWNSSSLIRVRAVMQCAPGPNGQSSTLRAECVPRVSVESREDSGRPSGAKTRVFPATTF